MVLVLCWYRAGVAHTDTEGDRFCLGLVLCFGEWVWFCVSGLVSPTQIQKVTEAVELVHAVLENHPQSQRELQPIIHCIYMLIQR